MLAKAPRARLRPAGSRRDASLKRIGLPSGDLTLVTGATGFVGSAVLKALTARGERVRVLVRPSSPRRNLAGVDCEIVEGDMTHAAGMERALRGVRPSSI